MSADRHLRLMRPQLPTAAQVLPYLQRMDAARHYTNFGPLVREFETRIAASLDWGVANPHVVTLSNCTVALQLWLQCKGLPPGSKVLLPALTFSATAQAILSVGLTPLFADVDAETWLLTPAHARAAMARHQIAAVLPVAAFGAAADTLAWQTFAADTGIPVLIDAAGAYANQTLAEGVDVALSFHATKTLPCGEGGAVVTTDAALAERLHTMSNFGIDLRDGYVRDLGSNGKMSEMHAAYGLASLDQFADTAKTRIALHRTYLDAVADLPVGMQQRPTDGVYSIFNVLLPTAAANVSAHMAAQGIECRRWYCPPLPAHPYFAACPRVGDLAVTSQLGEHILGLPFHLDLTATDVSVIIASLQLALTDATA